MLREYYNYITNSKKPQILVFLHNNADPDAIGSAFALKELSLMFNSDASILIFADGINQSATKAMQSYNLSTSKKITDINENDLIVILDTANIIQLGKYTEFVTGSLNKKMIIDHHTTKESSEGTIFRYLFPEAGSTCMILAKMFRHYDQIPTETISTLLIMGHLYDSRRFIHGVNEDSFLMMAKLISWGGDYNKANQFLQNEPNFSEKIAKIKAHQKLKYKTVNGFIIAASSIGAFEASAARSLINLGADVVLVLSGKKSELRGSARARVNLKLNVAEIVAKLSEKFGGEGGGHMSAAGFNIKHQVTKKEQADIINYFIKLTTQVLPSAELKDIE